MAITSTANLFNIAYGKYSTLTSAPFQAGRVYFTTEDTGRYIFLDIPGTDTHTAMNAPYADNAGLATQANKWVSNATLETKGSGPITLTVNEAGKTINAGSSISLTAGLNAKGITTTYLADSAVTTEKIANSAVTNAKLQYNYITIGGQNIALGGSLTAAALTQLRADLGLASALRFVGIISVDPTDGAASLPSGSGMTTGYTPAAGDVVMSDKTKQEYVYTGSVWRAFGDPDGFMTKLSSTYTKGATADGANLTVVTGIKQQVNGAITAYTGTLPNASTTGKGVASFNSAHFTTNNGAVSLNLGSSASWSAPAANKLNTPLVVTVSSNGGGNTVTHEENDLSSGKLDLKLPATITASLSGNATTATTATKLSSNAGNELLPVYFSGGKPVAVANTASGKKIDINIDGNADTATKWATATDIKIGNAAKEIQGGETAVIEFTAAEIGSTVVWGTWD